MTTAPQGIEPARIDRVTGWMDANGLGKLKAEVKTAASVVAMEKYIALQNAAPSSQAHRAGPEIPGYDKMSFEQRRLAQDQLKAARP